MWITMWKTKILKRNCENSAPAMWIFLPDLFSNCFRNYRIKFKEKEKVPKRKRKEKLLLDNFSTPPPAPTG
jgi:hypothetical protein